MPEKDSPDRRYVALVVDPIRVCAKYKPKLGQGGTEGMTLDGFKAHYGADVFYKWFGLDNPLLYSAHKAAGGMTSVYRQIGIGCEKLFRTILQDELGLSAEDSKWAYMTIGANKKARKLKLDGRIPLDAVKDLVKRDRVAKWILEAAADLDVADGIAKALQGVVFEVRQGYKSKDSKRQNADIANASTAYTQALLPCVALMSDQMDGDLSTRYRTEKWAILRGQVAGTNKQSIYLFMKEVIGYDLSAFFERNAGTFRTEVDKVLKVLLTTS